MYQVCVGGSQRARERWPARKYKYKYSAKRRVRQIANAHDVGIATIWTLKV